MRKRHAFTVIELLVIVAILTILIAFLLPSMSQALLNAQRTLCLVNQRTIATSLADYSGDYLGSYPPYRQPGVSGWGDAYGLRDDLHPYAGPKSGRAPFNVGLAVTGGYLPAGSLASILHCPTFDNSGMGGGAAGHCMDDVNPVWKGGSAWSSDPDWRVLSTYNYRGPSYQRNNNDTPPKVSNVATPSRFVLMIDTPDVRFRGWQSQYNAHEGYNYVALDLSSAYLADPTYAIDAIIATFQAGGQRGTVDGRGGGGGWGNGTLDEAIYAHIASNP